MKRSILFLAITFAINFSMVGVFYLTGLDFKSLSGIILGLIYMFVPTFSVILVKKIIYKENLRNSLAISLKLNKWFLVAWLIMPVLSFLTLGVTLLSPEVSYTPDMSGMFERFEHFLSPEQMEEMKTEMAALPVYPIVLALIQGLFAGVTINGIAGFGEELAWRGFLLDEFKNMSFTKGSLLIGFIWGIWHAPLILLGHNYPEHPVFGVLMMTIWCILLSPIFNYIRIKSKSVLAAALMHGTLNGTIGIAIMVIHGGNDLTTGMTGFPGFIVLTLAIAGFFVYDRYVSKECVMNNKIKRFI